MFTSFIVSGQPPSSQNSETDTKSTLYHCETQLHYICSDESQIISSVTLCVLRLQGLDLFILLTTVVITFTLTYKNLNFIYHYIINGYIVYFLLRNL